MPKIPRTEVQVGLRMANQPTMDPNALTGPGRALQSLGKAISGLQGAVEGNSEPTADEKFQAQLELVKFQNQTELEQIQRQENFTGSYDGYTQSSLDYFGEKEAELRGRISQNPKVQQQAALHLERIRGGYHRQAYGFEQRQRQGQLISDIAATATGEVARTQSGNIADLDLRLQGVEKMIDSAPGLSEPQREALRGEVNRAALSRILEGVPEEQQLDVADKLIKEWTERLTVREGEQRRVPGPQSSVNPILLEDQRAKLSGVRDEVVSKFSQLQGEFGRTFNVNSGYRDPEHNAKVGGAKNSQHTHRNAIDIDVSDLSPEDRIKVIEKASALGFSGIGIYKNSIHIDMGRRRAWGPSYGRKSVPDWAESAIKAHEGGRFASDVSGVEVAGGGPDYRGKGGPASIRFNNPGAMYPGPSSRKYGAVETRTIGGGHKIAVFPDAVSGAAAQFDLLSEKYTGRTLQSAISKWSGGNSVGTYLGVIKRETGLSPDTVLTKAMVADPKIAIPIAKAMAVQEAGKSYPMSDQQWAAAHQKFSGGGAQVAGSVKVASTSDFAPELPQSGQAPQVQHGTQIAEAGKPQWVRPSIRTKLVEDLIELRPALAQKQAEAVKRLEGAIRVSKFISGEVPFNAYSDDDRKLVDETFKLGDLDKRMFAGDPEAIIRGVEVAQRLNYAPGVVTEALTGLVKTTDPQKQEVRALGYEATASILSRNPNAFAASSGGKELADEASTYTALVRSGKTKADALMRIDEMKTPEWQQKAKVRKEAFTEIAKNIDVSSIKKHFDESWLPFTTPDAGVPDVMRDDFVERFREHYVRIGDEESAKMLAVADLKKTYGVSNVTGSAQIMQYPPDAHYPVIGKDKSYLSKDLERTVNDYLNDKIREVGAPVEVEDGANVKAEGIRLIPDGRTAMDIASNKPPTYQVMYKDDRGVWQIVPGARWGMQKEHIDQARKVLESKDAAKRRLEGRSIVESDAARKSVEYVAPHMLLRKGAQGVIDYFKGDGPAPEKVAPEPPKGGPVIPNEIVVPEIKRAGVPSPVGNNRIPKVNEPDTGVAP